MYKEMGMKGHNGWDLVSPDGTECLAVADGYSTHEGSTDSGYGLNIRLYVPVSETLELECVYGHLQAVRKEGKVLRGDIIGECDNTGMSTGSHLHFGIRMRKKYNSGSSVVDYNNGFLGYVDPTEFFPKSIFNLPVDDKYGETKRGMSEIQWYKANAYFWKVTGRLMSPREKNALVYGYWDLPSVLNPAMVWTWERMTKPEYLKRIGKL
jgi:murein DD-endopeptidase MepM/ murein hydrolase activator NlpD